MVTARVLVVLNGSFTSQIETGPTLTWFSDSRGIHRPQCWKPDFYITTAGTGIEPVRPASEADVVTTTPPALSINSIMLPLWMWNVDGQWQRKEWKAFESNCMRWLLQVHYLSDTTRKQVWKPMKIYIDNQENMLTIIKRRTLQCNIMWSYGRGAWLTGKEELMGQEREEDLQSHGLTISKNELGSASVKILDGGG